MQKIIQTEAYRVTLFIWIKNNISLTGLIEAGRNIFIYISKAAIVLILSICCAYLFWKVRAWIPSATSHTYKNYAIMIDSIIVSPIPSVWLQQNLRCEFFDNFFRGVWASYGLVILFGSTFSFLIRAETKRHFCSVILTLLTGLVIHFIVPTQPPWMALDNVIRIKGEYFTNIDKNLTAAMPSIHQAIICLAGCLIWKYGFFAKLLSVSYNFIMLFALAYLGEHYVIDSIVGIIVAIQSWLISNKIFNLFLPTCRVFSGMHVLI